MLFWKRDIFLPLRILLNHSWGGANTNKILSLFVLEDFAEPFMMEPCEAYNITSKAILYAELITFGYIFIFKNTDILDGL